MGLIKNLVVLGSFVAFGAVVYQTYLCPEEPLLKFEEKWFGKNKPKPGEPLPKDPVIISKFTVNVSNEVLQDLQRRLESSRFVEPIVGTQFNYGFNSDYLKKVVDYWRTKFDWRKQEVVINKFNHYKTQINGINIHYIHVKPSKPAKTVVPIIVIHGWPGSVWEYYKSIPLLIEPTNDIAFEIICPSIPGYGFSEAPQQEGFDVMQTAIIFVKLMERLGHKRYFVHGGDWGALITRLMALYYPQNVRGMHITMTGGVSLSEPKHLIKLFLGIFFPSLVFKNPETDYKKTFPLLEKFQFMLRESGYFHLQSTKPDTIGAALIDSPVGLAAYILEKFSTLTDPNNVKESDGGLTHNFTLDELLTNIMIYWTSNNVASSMRYYKENMLCYKRFIYLFTRKVSAEVSAAVADFPHELFRSPKEFAELMHGNLVQYTEMPRGGHFAALEEPKLVSNDIRKFVKTVLDNEMQQKSE